MTAKLSRGIICAVLVLAFIMSGCGKTGNKPVQNPEPVGKAYFAYFDTVSYVYSYAGDSAEQFDERSAEVSAILKKYHQLFDIYHEYSGTANLRTINSAAGGEPVGVDRELIDFLLYAKELYELTGGEMNVMMGSVLSLWHDCREKASDDPYNASIPGPKALEEASKHTDFSLLEINEAELTVRITDPEASIDVGALGKGYAVEKAAKALEAEGVTAYVLNVGGNIRAIGTKPDGSGWATGVRNPLDPDGDFIMKLTLSNVSCVTSGVYERYFTVDGQRYHHIIDKDTLFPAEHYSSVTILTPDSGLADALSTALFCMTPEEGLELVNKIGDVEVVWISPDGEITCTPGVEDVINN